MKLLYRPMVENLKLDHSWLVSIFVFTLVFFLKELLEVDLLFYITCILSNNQIHVIWINQLSNIINETE